MSVVARRTSNPKRQSNKLPVILAGVVVMLVVGIGAWRASGHNKPQNASSSSVTAQPATNPVATSKPQNNDTQLQQIVQQWAAQQSVKTAVVVTELTRTQRTASSDPTASMVPASTYKIYVAYAVLHAIEQGKYTLNSPLSDNNTIQTDLNAMILNSDNNAARTLGFLIGWQNINALLATQGITNTNLYNYVPPSTTPQGQKSTTAADLATILVRLNSGQLLNSAHTQLLLGLMKTQHYRQRVPAGVPRGVSVADKPGWLTVTEGDGVNMQNDAAIVYGPKSTYVLVVLTNGTSISPLVTLSQAVYSQLEQ